MDFQPWPNKIVPVCPNPHSLSELTSLLTEWRFEYDILVTNLTDNSYQVAATVDPHPDIAGLWGHLIATFPELGFWPVHTDGSLDELFDPDPDRIGTTEEFFAENTMPPIGNRAGKPPIFPSSPRNGYKASLTSTPARSGLSPRSIPKNHISLMMRTSTPRNCSLPRYPGRPTCLPPSVGRAPLTMITAALASLQSYAAGRTVSVPSSLA